MMYSTWPVELFSYVFELACTDDGQTARTLSLTSKPFREIARPFLYQSLVLSNSKQLTTLLLREVENSPSHLRRRIKHLFLALDRGSHSEGSCPAETLLIIKVLHLAAPTLQTFSFIAPCLCTGTSLLSYIFRTPFPSLEELTIAGLYPFSFPSQNFPRLRRLHFAAGNRNPFGLFTLGTLDKAFPELTHLRVSGLCRALPFVDELGQALRTTRKNNSSCDSRQDNHDAIISSQITTLLLPAAAALLSDSFDSLPIRLPAHLEKVYVQYTTTSSPALSRSSSWSSSVKDLTSRGVVPPTSNVTDTRQQTMMDQLMQLEGEFGAHPHPHPEKHLPVQLVVLDASPVVAPVGGNPAASLALRLKRDWLDRLNGGDGPW